LTLLPAAAAGALILAAQPGQVTVIGMVLPSPE
jgi:hypothetical protein